MQEIIVLACTECRGRNYSTRKNKKKNPERLERKRHCRICRRHTIHREVK